MKPTRAVLLMAYGGPDSLADVEPYLLDVRGGRATAPELVEEIRERYARIGGKSPLLEITCRQAQALEQVLNRSDHAGYQVFVGMRHWTPYIRAAVDAIAAAEIHHITAICMTPFLSRMSTGAYFHHLEQAVQAQAEPWQAGLVLRKIEAWYDHPGFVRALAENVRAGLKQFVQAGQPPMVAFTAHSLPAALAEQGDPYDAQFKALAGLVAQAAGLADDRWLTCYQSAGAQNTRWLGPSLEETIERLGSQGERRLLAAPVGFLADHVEILFDIDIEAQEAAAEAGVALARTASLNDQPAFIEALAEIVQGD